MLIYNVPFFPIPSCVFIGPLGNTNVGGRLTSQEFAVLLVGCHFLGGRPTGLPGRRKPPRENFQKFDLEVLVWWSSSLSMRTRIPKKRLEVVCPPGNTVITNDDTCRNSEGGKCHPHHDVMVSVQFVESFVFKSA